MNCAKMAERPLLIWPFLLWMTGGRYISPKKSQRCSQQVTDWNPKWR